MVDYKTLVNELVLFDLITREQANEALSEREHGYEEYARIKWSYQDAWNKKRESVPWWRRWLVSKNGWEDEYLADPDRWPKVRGVTW